MKKIYYEKVGNRYKPVAEYDSELIDSFTKGCHLVMVYPGGSSRRFDVDPAYAPLIAAGRVAEEAICDALRKATDLRPSSKPLTKGQIQAWQKLSEEFGEEAHMLTWPSARDASDAAVKAMITEADKLLNNPTVRKAFEKFLFVAELAKEKEHE